MADQVGNKNVGHLTIDFFNFQPLKIMLTCPYNVDPLTLHFYMSLIVRKPDFAYAKLKTQISFAVTAKLISAFVFAIRIVQSLYYLNPTFQSSSHLLWLYSPVCVGPGRKPRRTVFSQRGSYRNNGIYWGVHYFLIFALKHRLWV